VRYISAGDPDLKPPPLAWPDGPGRHLELGAVRDPLADGIVNQLAAQRGLASGTTPTRVLDTVAAIRRESEIPIVLYLYFNLIHRVGLDRFIADAARAGVDGLLVLDLPPEESAGYEALMESAGLCNIYLIAPTARGPWIIFRRRASSSITSAARRDQRLAQISDDRRDDVGSTRAALDRRRLQHFRSRTGPRRGNTVMRSSSAARSSVSSAELGRSPGWSPRWLRSSIPRKRSTRDTPTNENASQSTRGRQDPAKSRKPGCPDRGTAMTDLSSWPAAAASDSGPSAEKTWQYPLLGDESSQQAVQRVLPVVPIGNILIITNAAQAGEYSSSARLPQENVYRTRQRDTCTAVALGAALVGAARPPVMAVLPADHVIGEERSSNRSRWPRPRRPRPGHRHHRHQTNRRPPAMVISAITSPPATGVAGRTRPFSTPNS
jgi:hypothetical protein